MNTAMLLVKCLEQEQVKYVFGLPGEENLEFLYALQSSSIKTIITRDERGASFMANAYGRLTGQAGVCFATLGPGATNLVTGTADALLDFAPMLAITAQASSQRQHKESHQYIDVLNMFKPIVKWSANIDVPQSTPEIIQKAFKTATSEKSGPVHVQLPEDVASMAVTANPLKPKRLSTTVASEKDINKALSILKDSKNPLILAGHGVIRNNACDELVEFASKAGIHVLCTFMGMGAMPADHRLFISTIGLQAREYVQCGIDRADLIIAIGYDPVEFSPKWWDSSKKVIHIDAVSSEVDVNYDAFDLVGDIKTTLSALIDKIDITFENSYYASLKTDIEMLATDSELLNSSQGITPLKILTDIRSALSRDDILISDVGAHKIWMGRFYKAYKPNTALISNGFASMGFAVPAGLSARLACPDKKVAVLTGDAGFMMSVCELETACRYGLGFVVVICSDSGYGLIKWKQQNRYKTDFFVDFTNPDFTMLAKSFGCDAYKVSSATEFLPAFKEALSHSKPVIIDCKVDYSVNTLLSKKLGQVICRI